MSSHHPPNFGDTMEPIAIVGMACRFPGEATTPSKFWNMIVNGRTGHSPIPEDRFNANSWYHPNHERKGTIQPRSGFFLEESPAVFDAPFFSMTGKEAAGMDPMQRKLLEISYEAFENAGIPMSRLVGSSTGVYSGVMTNDYELITAGDAMQLPQNAASGTSRAMLSNRISWFFDLRGPSFALDTACSSSLYALHLACQSLRTGESEQALVTGVNSILAPNFISQLSSMHMLSPDGKSHSFDSRANGYARGEAVAAIVVKSLGQAMADGDTIRAVIRGSAINQDGKTVGITIPNGEAQADLIRTSYDMAGLNLDETGYFEAHGTGTPVGDPIELSAIGNSFGSHRNTDNPLIVGSVKTNIGHTEGAAGLAGVIKTVLSLENGIIPPLADFQELNPKLRLDDWKLALPLKALPWPISGCRRASVNSFGFGGANAHVILDDAYHYLLSHGLKGRHRTTVFQNDDSSDSGVSLRSEKLGDESHQQDQVHPPNLFIFSAYDAAGIARTQSLFSDFLAQEVHLNKDQCVSINELAYTLCQRRTLFDFRSFTVASSLSELTSKLGKDGLPKFGRISRHDNPIFVFTGQGAQWAAMGRELLPYPAFVESLKKSQATLDSLGCQWSVLDLLCDPNDTRIDSPAFSQPVCTILQVALTELIRYWGIKPRATVGHSSGEVAAAYAADLISLEDAARIAYWRGFYSERVKDSHTETRGAMMAVGMPEAKAKKYLSAVPEGTVVIGCVNSPSSVTLSGDVGAIEHLEALIKGDGHFARKLRVQVAYHSHHMRVVADEFLEALGSLHPKSSNIPMFSSVTEQLIEDPSTLVAQYWLQNLISPVRFSGALTTLLNYLPAGGSSRRKIKWSSVIEIGPHEALKGPCRQIMSAWDSKSVEQIPYMSLLSRGKHAQETALTAAGTLWAYGHNVDLQRINLPHDDYQVAPDLPPYAWNHEKTFWHEPKTAASIRLRKEPRNDLLGMAVSHQNPFERSWHNYLSSSECPWINDHVITGTVLYPGAGHLVMALEAARRLADPEKTLVGVEFSNVRFSKGLVIPPDDEKVETILTTKPHETLSDWYYYTLYSVDSDAAWTKHSWGSFTIHYSTVIPQEQQNDYHRTYKSLRSQAVQSLNIPKFYDQLQSIGVEYGSTFRNVVEAAVIPGEHSSVGSITVADTQSVMPYAFEYPHLIHPATLDAIFHLIFAAIGQGEPLSESAIPTKIDRLCISTNLPLGVGAKFTGFSHTQPIGVRDTLGTIVVSDEDWSSGPKVVVEGMVVTEVSSGASKSSDRLSGSPRRIATLDWKEDLDGITGQAGIEWLSQNSLTSALKSSLSSPLSTAVCYLESWLDLACFKHADWRVLILYPSGWENSTDILWRFGTQPGERFRFSETVIVESTDDSIAEIQNTMEQGKIEARFIKMDFGAGKHIELKEQGAFDLIIAPFRNTRLLADLSEFLRPEGRAAFVATGSFDPLDRTSQGDQLSNFKQRIHNFSETDGSELLIADLKSEASLAGVHEVVILHSSNPGPSAITLGKRLTEQLNVIGIRSRTATMPEASTLAGCVVISLVESENPFVIAWESADFEQFRDLTTARYVLWLTRGGLLDAGEASLAYAPSSGLLRTVRVEKPQILLPHLDLSPELDLSSQPAVDIILSVFSSTIKAPINNKNNEMEYAELNGILRIPRAQTNEDLDYELSLRAGLVASVQGPLYQPNTCRRLESQRPGHVSSLRWVTDDSLPCSLADTEVEMQPSHISLDRFGIKLFTSKGQQTSPTLGRGVVGTVTRVGSKASTFVPGDMVFTLHYAPFRTHLRIDDSLLHKVPASMSPAEAAVFPLVAAQAWHALINIAGFRAGKSVFINGGADALGQTLIQLVQVLRGEVFVSAPSTERQWLENRYKIPLKNMFDDSNPSSWVSDILLTTKGKGIDIVINNRNIGASVRALSASIADDGRFVDISQQVDTSMLAPNALQHNVSLSFLNFDSMSDRELLNLTKRAVGLAETGCIGQFHSISQFPVSELPKAMESLQSNELSIAPIVIAFTENATVPLAPSLPPPLNLRADGTYILAGGLGALGLTIANNMCEHGCRHLVFLSRSGASSTLQQESLHSLRARGCAVDVVKCDVTDEKQIMSLAQRIKEEFWNVRGIIQLAMVLRDSIFENMTFDKWQTAINPKIKGTWNLHHHLPQELDFFIVLSSLSGIIGNTAQANYCAGNTYEDALAHHRRKLGLAATTLNVGLVTDASHFNEDNTIEDYLRKYSHWIPAQVSDAVLQHTLIAVMRGYLSDGSSVPDQLLVGLSDTIRRDGDSLNLWPMDRKFDHRISLATTEATSAENNIAQQLKDAQNIDDAQALVETALKVNIASAMTASPDVIDVEKPLYSFGIDSLKAIEVRNWIFNELKADISVFDILSPAPLTQLATKIVSKSSLVAVGSAN